MKSTFVMLAALLGSIGCAGISPDLRITTDRQSYTPLIREELQRPCKSPLRVCVMNASQGALNKARTAVFGGMFASAVQRTVASPDACDLGIVFVATLNDSIEVFAPNAAPPGAFLARIDVGSDAWAARALCAATAPGGAIHGQLYPEARAAVAAAAPVTDSPSSAAPPAAQGLSAADIERIAKAVKTADRPAAAPAAPTETAVPRFSAPERPDDLAVIVGIESYSDIASKASYAERDATAFKAFVRALGVPERNIVLLTGSKAVRSALTKNIEGWLPRVAKPDSRVYFYFSGHGAPDVKTGQAYLVPWDGDPNFLGATAYPVAQLYKKLGDLPVRQVLVAMDSCFSGAGGRSVLATGARPLVSRVVTGEVPAKVTVLAASGADEISGSLDDKRHGAFTYFLLEGLNAGKTTPKELTAYLTPKVQDEARRLNRDQTPRLLGGGDWPLR